jgi:hypothetical protein
MDTAMVFRKLEQHCTGKHQVCNQFLVLIEYRDRWRSLEDNVKSLIFAKDIDVGLRKFLLIVKNLFVGGLLVLQGVLQKGNGLPRR